MSQDFMTPEKVAAIGCREALRYALAELLRANLKLKDREARLKAARTPVSGGLAELCVCNNGSCAWCIAFRATDLRVRDWKGKP